jgi:hypothetical protein
MATALQVEISNPILPFSSIPLTFDWADGYAAISFTVNVNFLK